MSKIDWDNQFKIRLSNASIKHEVIKLLLVRKLIKKYPRERIWLRIYTEFSLENNCKPDVYFEHVKDKSIIIYEIQKAWSEKWLKEKINQYKEYEVPFFTVDFIPIKLEDFSNDIDEIDKKLEEFVF